MPSKPSARRRAYTSSSVPACNTELPGKSTRLSKFNSNIKRGAEFFVTSWKPFGRGVLKFVIGHLVRSDTQLQKHMLAGTDHHRRTAQVVLRSMHVWVC